MSASAKTNTGSQAPTMQSAPSGVPGAEEAAVNAVSMERSPLGQLDTALPSSDSTLAVSTTAEPLDAVSTSSEPDPMTEAPPTNQRRVMKDVARAGLRMLVGVVPALLGSGLWGAVKGFFLFGAFGLALAGTFVLAPRWLGMPPTPGWLEALSLGLTPFALALAGGYALMLNGVGSRLAQEAQERGWMGYAYAVLKPAALHVARRLRSTGPLGRKELIQAIEHSVAEQLRELPEERTGPPSRTERLERFLMEQSYRVLGAVALRTVLTAPDTATAVRGLETLAVDRLEGALVETLEDVFFVQQVLALIAGVLVAAIPTFILLFSR
ncbi:hypothetical protein [Myxococcus sp. CA033]|uniref:hypothetical protein n=1 Tax=Myxococcus sp. CA033 TaxID=2741516 RepID=UPI00352CD396